MRKFVLLTLLLFFILLACAEGSTAPQTKYKPEDLRRNYIVYDYYTDWCSVCKRLEPQLENLAVSYEGKVKVNRVNIERHPQLAREKGIRGVPTLILSDGVHDLAKSAGYMSYSELVAWIHKIDSR